jgi:predicted dienelactone hydrolase
MTIRSRIVAGLVGALSLVVASVAARAGAAASALDGAIDDSTADEADGHRVGHRLVHVTLKGSVGEVRNLPVDIWYPVRNLGFDDAPATVYRSGLFGVPLTPAWDPLSWSITSEVAREDVSLRRTGHPYPLIIFSHGSTSEPLRYAKTLEALAAEGFVVAAPKHIGNSQDDVRADFINAAAKTQVLSCEDGTTSPCADPSVPVSMRNRALDVEAVAQAVGALFGAWVDTDRIGVLGHSRGTTTALTAAGGSTVWNIPANPRVKAIMGMAIAPPNLTFSIDLGQIQIPTVLVAGGNDHNTPAFISETAFAMIPSSEKALIELRAAVHKHFTASQCSAMQSSGSVAQANVRAILDRHTFDRIAVDPVSGSSLDYCAFPYFVDPVDVRPLVFADTGYAVTATNVPRTGLTSDEVDQVIVEVSSTLFGTVLRDHGSSGDHFTRFLAPKYLIKHEPSVTSAEAWAEADAICPHGLEVACED